MKPRIIIVVPNNAACDRRQLRVGILNKFTGLFCSDTAAAIDHAEPIWNGRSGKKIRIVDKQHAVGEVVHTNLGALLR